MEFLALAAVLLGVIVLQNWLFQHKALEHLEYRCYLTADQVFEGDEIELVEELANKKWLPIPWLKSEITTSRWLDFAGAQSVVSDQSRFVPSFFMLGSYQKIVRRWKVRCLKRGEFEIEKVVLVSTDLFGSRSFSRPEPVTAQILVLPRPLGDEALAVRPRYLNGDILVRRQLLDDPFMIAGVREYTERDPMNKIHWSATAKEGRIMVYHNDYTSSQSVTVVLNLQSRPLEHFETLDRERMEDAIRVCARLFDETLQTGMPLRFLVNGSVDASRNSIVTSEYWGSEYVESLLQLLAKLKLASTEDFSRYLAGIYHDVTSTDLVIVTLYLNEAMTAFARRKDADGVHVRLILLGALPPDLDTSGCDLVILSEKGGEPDA